MALEKERQATLEEFNVTETPDLETVRSVAAQLFSQPLEQQNVEELKKLSEAANRIANLVKYIYDEYDNYSRENYKYDFLQKKYRGPSVNIARLSTNF